MLPEASETLKFDGEFAFKEGAVRIGTEKRGKKTSTFVEDTA